MDNSNYCTDCKQTLVIHADGSVACSCNFLDSDSSEIPETWELTSEQLHDARAEEEAYGKTA